MLFLHVLFLRHVIFRRVWKKNLVMSDFSTPHRKTRSSGGSTGGSTSSRITTRQSEGFENKWPTPLPVYGGPPQFRCLCFGPLRKEKWGALFDFCTACDEAEAAMRKNKLLKWPKNLESRRYKCTVGHERNDVPNRKSVTPWRPSKGISPKVNPPSASPQRKKKKLQPPEALLIDSEDEEEKVDPPPPPFQELIAEAVPQAVPQVNHLQAVQHELNLVTDQLKLQSEYTNGLQEVHEKLIHRYEIAQEKELKMSREIKRLTSELVTLQQHVNLSPDHVLELQAINKKLSSECE